MEGEVKERWQGTTEMVIKSEEEGKTGVLTPRVVDRSLVSGRQGKRQIPAGH